MAEENIVPNQLNENKDNTQVQQQAPVYNPFLGLTYKQFNQILAGDNPDAPLIETDIYGNVTLHPENVGKSGPAKVNVDAYGQKNVQRTQEQLLKDFEKEQEAVAELYGALAPKFSQHYSKNALPLQLAHATGAGVLGGNLLDAAGKSFGSTALNIANAALAQKRNYAEAEWKSYLSLVDNSDGSIQMAQQIVDEYESQGLNFQYANVNKFQTTNKVKDILTNYKKLLGKRHEDEQNMKIAAIFEEEDGPYSRWAQNASWIPEPLKELKGNKNSIVGMATELGGQVAGSLAFYYAFGTLTGGATAGMGRLIGAGSKIGRAMIASSAAVGEYSVFAPSFLNQYSSVRTQALMNGADIDTANAAGFWAGMLEGGLEMVGFRMFNRLYTRGGYLYNAILKGMVPEALQEGAQTFSEDIITNRFGITEKDFGEVMTDVGLAMLGGALGGGVMMSGRFNLEGITAASMKIADNFHRTIDKHTAADVAAGVAQAKEKIQAENSDEAPLKEPTKIATSEETKQGQKPSGEPIKVANERINAKKAELNSSEKAKTEKQKVKETFQKKEVNPLEEFSVKYGYKSEQATAAETNGQPKAEEVINQSQTTEEGAKEVADAVYEMYNEMKRLANDKVRARYGKKVTDTQMKQLWNAVSEQVFLQAQDNSIADAFNGQIDRAMSLIDMQNKAVKENAKKTQKLLLKKGFTAEQAEKLTSSDWSVRHEAQWDLATEEIVDMFKRNGASESEGKLFAKWLKGLYYNTTFLNPQIKVSDLVSAMNDKLINVQRGILHEQEMPNMFKTPLSEIEYRKFANPQEAKAFADKIVNGLTEAKSPTNLAYIKKDLFGEKEIDDKNFQKTLSALEQQAEIQKNILDAMPISNKPKLDKGDYLSIALLRFMGVEQSDIDNAYGFTYNGESTPEDSYNEISEKLFPSLSAEELLHLNNISNAKEPELSNKETLNKLNKAIGFYEAAEGVAVIKSRKPGVVLHEAGHMTMAGAILDGLGLERLGLLPQTNTVSSVLNHLASKMQRDGYRVTDEQLQETTLDALARMIVTGQVDDDPELTALFTQLKEDEKFSAEKQLSGSLMFDRVEGQRKGGNLSKEQKEGVKESVLNVLKNKNAANQIYNANQLQKLANFETGADNDSALAAKENGQTRLDMLRNEILYFLDNNIIEDDAGARQFIDILYKSKDLFTLSHFIHNLALQAKNLSFSAILNEMKGSGTYDSSLVEDTGSFIMFMAKEGNGKKLNSKKTYNPNYKANFREQPKDLWQSTKESFSFLEIYEGGKDVLKRYLQSLEGAAPTDMARHLLMQQFFTFSKRSQRASELLAKVVTPLDNKMKEAQKQGEQAYEDLKRRFQNKFFAVLADGKKGAYKVSSQFIEEELGKEAGEAWWQICGLIKELTGSREHPGLLQLAGIPADLINFEGDYFPLQVANFEELVTEYFHHAKVFNEIEKLKNRLLKRYEESYGGKIPLEKKAQIDAEISDKVNALFQRYQSDEHALSSFQHKQLFDYGGDPSILNYYADPFDTVSKYLDAAYRTIMMRNLVGKVTYDENGKPNLDFKGYPGSLGRYLSNLPVGEVGNQALNNFKEKLAYLAQRDSGSGSLIDSIRKINQITTLGSIFNAINQGMDLSFAAHIFGLRNTVSAFKEVVSGKGIKISDVYAQSSNEVFRMQGEGILSRIGKKVFKLSGFEYADIKVKEVILNASTKFFQQGLNSKENTKAYKDAMYYIDQIWPEASGMRFSESVSEKAQEKEQKIHNTQRDMVIESLKRGEDNDYTRFVKWFMLTKTQPINAATVPAIYNAMGPFGKICYQFSTVAIRQLEFLTDRIQMRLRAEGNFGAAKEFAKLAMFLAALGLPKELLENMMKGRKTDVLKTVALSPFHIFMINEYTIAVAQRDGLASAAATITAPSFGLLDNVSRDLFRAVTFQSYKGNTWKSVPLFGWAAYWWIFGGREQSLKNKTALVDFSEEQKQQEDNRIASNLNYLETGED